MKSRQHPPLTRNEVRDVDRRAIDEYGLPGIVLMENAGRGTAELLAGLGIGGSVVICAGKGNNGGDGFVIARHLENRGAAVKVLLCCAPADLSSDAAINYEVLRAAGTPLVVLGKDFTAADVDRRLAGADWIVDALLGTGVAGAAREPLATVIRCINRTDGKVLAVDLPSGLDCDTGRAEGDCVRAAHTATFVAPKVGFDQPTAGEFTGEVHVIDIGVPRVMLEQE